MKLSKPISLSQNGKVVAVIGTDGKVSSNSKDIKQKIEMVIEQPFQVPPDGKSEELKTVLQPVKTESQLIYHLFNELALEFDIN